jgi:hypothetical protein
LHRILIIFCVLALTLPIAAQEPAVPLRGDAGAEIDYATARQTRRLEAIRAAGDITLDGILEEPAWTQAAIASHFIQNEPREGQPATYDTEVRVLYDDRALYFGVFARDNEPNRIIVSDLKKDFDTTSSDGFRIILDTFRDELNGYQFATNPAGAKWDAQMTNEGRENNANWDGIWEVATRIVATGWYAEIRIPFRTLRFNAGDGEVWGVNFERKIRRLNEDSYWAPIPRIYDIQSTLVTGRANYNFNTKMFLNALVQYNSDSQQWSSNLRLNIIHRPLSDFFLVYNERRDERAGDLLNRALVAKFTYLVAF